jgi:hypothetical protein
MCFKMWTELSTYDYRSDGFCWFSVVIFNGVSQLRNSYCIGRKIWMDVEGSVYGTFQSTTLTFD